MEMLYMLEHGFDLVFLKSTTVKTCKLVPNHSKINVWRSKEPNDDILGIN